MPIELSCPCGNGDLTEIPSGENSNAYECGDCGTTILIQFIKSEEESKQSETL